MGKRGPKPKVRVKIKWSPKFSYAMGLLATDGCLSSDGLLIDLTSKDREQLVNYSRCLGADFKIGKKCSSNGKDYLRVEFKNRIFYDFLLSIGLTPRKSLTMGRLAIPDQYFFDFLRGCFDGDGCFYSYWDPRWRSSHMFYIVFASASKKYLDWLREILKKKVNIWGHITSTKKSSFFQLKYAKREALEVIKKMYYNPMVICLSRKKIKIKKALEIEKIQQRTYKI